VSNVGLWAGIIASVVPLGSCDDRKDAPLPELPVKETLSRPTAPPARYFVSPDGSDAAAGTRTAPFRSIQRGADAARPGDTVVVLPGRYIGGERIVSLVRGGRPEAWITFVADKKWKAIIDGRGGKSLEAWYFGPAVAYVRIEGFEIRDLQEHAFDTYGGGVHDVIIARNLVHHIGRNCTDTSNGRTGASLGADTRRVIFDGNVWHDIGRLAPAEHGCAPRTAYYQNHDHAIYVADAHEVTIINNVFYNLQRGWAVHRYSSRGTPTHGLLIANNTFAGANPYRPGQIILATTSAGLRIENNIFHSPRSAALYFENLPFPDALVRSNMVSGAVLTLGRPRQVTFKSNWERTDPEFASPGDFRLQRSSPAIDAGVLLPEVSHDAEGVSRPQGRGYDLGAYEH
jgi:Right handed beta helix region